jgi:hypothetical protein
MLTMKYLIIKYRQEQHSDLLLLPRSRNLIKVRFVNLSASKNSILKSIVEKSRHSLPLTLNRWREMFFSDIKHKINAGKQVIVRAMDIICVTERAKRS